MKSPNKKSPLYNYGRYSSMALQMGIIICIGIFGGFKLDKYLNLKFPAFTIALSIISVVLAIYIVTRDLMK
jgi:hypothetical protein